MAEDGKIIYQVEVKSDNAVQEAKRGGEEAGQAFSSAGKTHGGIFQQVMTGAARAVGEAFVQMAGKAINGVKQIAQAGIEFNSKMETYQTAFTTLIGDADAAAAAIEQIRADAAATPFDVDSLVSANQALLATGMSADQARSDIMNLANAIAATGGGSAELSRMAANMQQIQNTGKATAMDIRQFANAGINIYGLLADSMGITTEEAAKMDVTYEQLSEAFAHAAEAGGMYEGAMEAQSQTFEGRMSTLKDNVQQLEGALTEDLFSRVSGDLLPQLQEWVGTLLEAAQTGGIEGAWTAAKEILSGLVNSFIEDIPTLIDTGMELLVGLMDGMSSAAPGIISTIGHILAALLTAIWEHLPELLAAGVRLIDSIITGMASLAGEFLQPVAEGLAQIGQAFAEAWEAARQWGSDLIQNLIDGIRAKIADLVATISEVAGKVKSFLGFSEPEEGPLSDFHTYAPDMMDLFASGIEGNKVVVTHAIENAFDLAPAIEGAAFSGASPAAYVSDRMRANAGVPADSGAGSIAQSISDGFQNFGQTGSGGIHTAIFNVNGREFARATFNDYQAVANDHGVSLIIV